MSKAIAAELHFPKGITADSILHELLGWLQARVLSLWRVRKTGCVSTDELINQLHAIYDRHRREKFREKSISLFPSVPNTDLGKNRGRTFVKQIELISEDDNLIIKSIKNYIYSCSERLRLYEEGNITKRDWDDFDRQLIERWESIFKKNTVLYNSEDPKQIGIRIFFDSTEHCHPLAAQPTHENYLTAGTYHNLAEDLKVGWHPSFESLMKQAP